MARISLVWGMLAAYASAYGAPLIAHAPSLGVAQTAAPKREAPAEPRYERELKRVLRSEPMRKPDLSGLAPGRGTEKHTMEGRVWSAQPDEFQALEWALVRRLVQEPSSVEVNYLLSILYGRMAEIDDGSSDIPYGALAAQLAAHTIELDASDDRGHLAMEEVLLLSGNASTALIYSIEVMSRSAAGSGEGPILRSANTANTSGWRLALAQARAAWVATPGDEGFVLGKLHEIMQMPGADAEVVASATVTVVVMGLNRIAHASQKQESGEAGEGGDDREEGGRITAADASAVADHERTIRSWRARVAAMWELSPTRFHGLVLALLSHRLGEMRLASRYYDKVLGLDPDDRVALRSAGLVLIQDIGRHRRGAQLLRRYLAKWEGRLPPGEVAGAYGALAESELRRGHKAGFVDAATKMLHLAREGADGTAVSDLFQRVRGKAAEASLMAAAIKRHMDLEGALPDLKGAEGWLLLDAGSAAQAARAFEDAILLAPDDARHYLGLARAQAAQGRKDEAGKAALAGLRVSPRDKALLELSGTIAAE